MRASRLGWIVCPECGYGVSLAVVCTALMTLVVEMLFRHVTLARSPTEVGVMLVVVVKGSVTGRGEAVLSTLTLVFGTGSEVLRALAFRFLFARSCITSAFSSADSWLNSSRS